MLSIILEKMQRELEEGVTSIKDINGKTHYVLRKDLTGKKAVLPLYTKNGNKIGDMKKSENGEVTISRDNIQKMYNEYEEKSAKYFDQFKNKRELIRALKEANKDFFSKESKKFHSDMGYDIVKNNTSKNTESIWLLKVYQMNTNSNPYVSLYKIDSETLHLSYHSKGNLNEAAGCSCNNYEEEYEEVKEHNSEELLLFMDNDSEIYHKYEQMLKIYSKKMKKGSFYDKFGIKGFMHLVNSAAKKYAREMDETWNEAFPIHVREEVAKELNDRFKQQFKNKEYDFMK